MLFCFAKTFGLSTEETFSFFFSPFFDNFSAAQPFLLQGQQPTCS